MLAEDSFSGSAEAESRALIQQMSQSLGLLRVAFDSTGEAMLIVDESSAVRWANQQAADLWGGGRMRAGSSQSFAPLSHRPIHK